MSYRRRVRIALAVLLGVFALSLLSLLWGWHYFTTLHDWSAGQLAGPYFIKLGEMGQSAILVPPESDYETAIHQLLDNERDGWDACPPLGFQCAYWIGGAGFYASLSKEGTAQVVFRLNRPMLWNTFHKELSGETMSRLGNVIDEMIELGHAKPLWEIEGP